MKKNHFQYGKGMGKGKGETVLLRHLVFKLHWFLDNYSCQNEIYYCFDSKPNDIFDLRLKYSLK